MIIIYWSEQKSSTLPEGGDSINVSVESLHLDIVDNDSYDVSSMVTTFAMESGVPITDHVLPNQDRVTFTAMISGRQSTTKLVTGAKVGSFDATDGVTGAGIIVPANTDRIGDVHETLRRLCREGTEVDVDGLRRPIEGWIIETVSSPRTIETSGLLVVDVTIVEVRFADTEEVAAPSPRVERGRRRRDSGRQRTTESTISDDSEGAEVSTDARNRSVAHRLLIRD